MAPQVPALWPLGMLQTPVQHSPSLTQMSPTCVQYEIVDGDAHTLAFGSQTPLQQSPLPLHGLPAVWQPEPICWHMPLVQVWLQQAGPPAVQACPSAMHCAAPQTPLLQFRLQQSV